MHFALVNPNTNAATTMAMLAIARATAGVSVRLDGWTAEFGADLICDETGLATAADAVVAFGPTLRANRTDGVIIAAFGDPGRALSGGQQQRLCIARSLAVSPQVLLMDEPCSALDPTSTRRIEQTISEISETITVVIVTHTMQQAQRVSHRCAFFLAAENEPGRIIEEGPTKDIFTNPRDERTNDYVNGRFG